MSVSKVTTKKQTTATPTAMNKPAWAVKANDAIIKNRENLMEMGIFFQGKPGETVRGIFLDDGLAEGKTKGGSDVFTINVMRLSSHKEQTFSVLQGIATVVGEIMKIAETHNWNLREVVFDATFTAGKNGTNFVKTIKEVHVPKMEAV
jgi:hypothetical protein